VASPAALSPVSEAVKERPPEPKTSNEEQPSPATDASFLPPKHDAVSDAEMPSDIQALWNLVENGDTRAEVGLADRYLRGDGVPQSCAQGRVLLEAAVKRGSAEARKRFDGLVQAGCP
jgi:TPR repeat protein